MSVFIELTVQCWYVLCRCSLSTSRSWRKRASETTLSLSMNCSMNSWISDTHRYP